MSPPSIGSVLAAKAADRLWRSAAVTIGLWIGGCGGCQPPNGELATPTGSASEASIYEGGTAGDSEGAGEIPLLPVLNREALSARAQAQRVLLGGRDLFEDERGNPVPWISAQAELPVADPSIDDALLDSLPGSSGLGSASPLRGSGVNGNALGLFSPLRSEPAEAPLADFYRALRELRNGRDPDGKVRVLVYGASHTDADIYPHFIRTYLQERFGDGGHGFVHVAKPWRWYRHVDVEVDGLRHWITEHAQRREGRDDGLYGLLGASLSASTKRAFGKISHRDGSVASSYEFSFLAQPRGGSFDVYVDGTREATVHTHADTVMAGFHRLDVAEGRHDLEVRLRGNGEVRLFGVVSERERPGVVVDTLGIGGTRAANILEWDEGVWADSVRRRDPSLVILAYGTNEATDEDQPIEDYESDLRLVIDRVQRAAPQASCLLVGPGDFPYVDGGSVQPRPRLLEIVEAQTQIAQEMGCAFWDMLAFMGGELSMVEWVSSVPPMAKADYTHLTRRGYVRMGMALVDAMMLDFDANEVLSAAGLGQLQR